ncbi:MAG: TetR family transcriptional regulator [Spirochaetaceae bacterium]|nr:MAG: TetR family transcriptional regulator [Spirochaetaceae bacterium]
MRRTAEEAQQTRETVFKAGLRVFSQRGFEGATLADVAREAGVTRGAIYWHFRNKEAFFEEILGRLERFYEDLLRVLSTGGEPDVETVCEAVRGIFQRFCTDSEYRAMQTLAIRSLLQSGPQTAGYSAISQRIEADSKVIKRAGVDLRHLSRPHLPEPLVPLRAYLFGVFVVLAVRIESGGALDPGELEPYLEFLRGALSKDS